MDKTTKPSREEVLRATARLMTCHLSGEELAREIKTELLAMYEAGAAAMYAKGADDMRERAAAECDMMAKGWCVYRDHKNHAYAASACGTSIRALPIAPTNTEGEQG